MPKVSVSLHINGLSEPEAKQLFDILCDISRSIPVITEKTWSVVIKRELYRREARWTMKPLDS